MGNRKKRYFKTGGIKLMCGLFGAFGQPNRKTPKVIRHLAILNMDRGKDSTGIALVSKDKTIIYKDIVPADKFFDYELKQELNNHRLQSFCLYMGHTRAATHGAVTIENSHPFTEKDIVFTHNGIIHNFYELQNKYKTNYDVDSQMIGHVLAKKKIKGLDELAGYFTAPYIFRHEPDVLRVAIHNNVFNYAIRGNQMFYSSTKEHLEKALVNKPNFKFTEITRLDDSMVLSFYSVNNSIVVAKETIKPQTGWESFSGYYSKGGKYHYPDSNDYGYDQYENDEFFRGECYMGSTCPNATSHSQIKLPYKSDWEQCHVLKLSSECTFYKTCPWKNDHDLMDKLDKQYRTKPPKKELLQRMYEDQKANKEDTTKKLFQAKYKSRSITNSKKKDKLSQALDSLKSFAKQEVATIFEQKSPL